MFGHSQIIIYFSCFNLPQTEHPENKMRFLEVLSLGKETGVRFLLNSSN